MELSISTGNGSSATRKALFFSWHKFCHCPLIDIHPTVYKQSTGCPKSPFGSPSSISTSSGFALNQIPFHFALGCHVSSNRDRKAMVWVRQILIFSPHPFGGTRHSKQTLPQNLATWSLNSQCIWVPGWGPGPVHTWIKKIKIFFQRREAFLTASVNSAVCFQCEPVFQARFPQGGPADLHMLHSVAPCQHLIEE